MPVRRELAITAAAIAAAGALVGGVAAMSSASTTSPMANTGYTRVGSAEGQAGDPGGAGRGGHMHTAVTGTELAKVAAAVKAKDAAVTVQQVRKDPDGSYDVMGTKAGAPVMLEVSKDLKTIQTRTGGPGGPGGAGRGGHMHTAVTGTELAKVTAAVKAKDAAVTVQQVRKDPDGSYDVMGTKAGAPVMLEVSKDLKTIQTRTGGPGGPGGPGGAGRGGHMHTAVTGTELAKVTAAVKAKDAAVTVQQVRKDPDGSYDVMGTKAGALVMLEVSKDLKTIQTRTGGPGGPGGGPQPAPSASSSSTSTT